MEVHFFETPAEWRAWLEANHDTATEVEVGFRRRASGLPTMTWSQAVDEALCFGWIDGVRHSIDEISYRNRFTPRKPTSAWSNVNIAKVEALEAAGKMTDAGRAAFARRAEANSGSTRSRATAPRRCPSPTRRCSPPTRPRARTSPRARRGTGARSCTGSRAPSGRRRASAASPSSWSAPPRGRRYRR